MLSATYPAAPIDTSRCELLTIAFSIKPAHHAGTWIELPWFCCQVGCPLTLHLQ